MSRRVAQGLRLLKVVFLAGYLLFPTLHLLICVTVKANDIHLLCENFVNVSGKTSAIYSVDLYGKSECYTNKAFNVIICNILHPV